MIRDQFIAIFILFYLYFYLLYYGMIRFHNIPRFNYFLRKFQLIIIKQQKSIMIFKVILNKEIHIVKSTDKPTLAELKKFLPSYFKKLPEKYILSYLDEDGDEIVLNDQYDYEILLGSSFKTAKINIKENNDDFMQLTERIQLVDIVSQSQPLVEEKNEVQVPLEPVMEDKKQISYIQEKNQNSFVVDDSLIEQKLKKMMPQIISKIKSQISSQALEQSKLSSNSYFAEKNSQPTIVQQESVPSKKVKVQDQSKIIHTCVTCDGCGKKNIEGIRYKCSVCDDFDFCQACQANVQHDHPFLKIKHPRHAPRKIFVVLDNQDESSFSYNGNRVPLPSNLDNVIHQGMNLFKGFLQGEQCQQLKNKFKNMKEEWKKGDNPMRNCGMFRKNCHQNRTCETKEQKTEMKEQKIEMKEEVPQVKKQVIVQEPKIIKQEPKIRQIPQQFILTNANYLVQVFDVKFQKAITWANKFPEFSKEELLNYCINQPSFFY